MAKTITEQLMALLSPEEQAVLRAKIDANPTLVAQDKKSAEIYSIYAGEIDEPAAPVVAAPATVTPAATTPSATAAPTAPSASTAGAEFAALTAKLDTLSATLTGQLDQIKKDFVPVSELPKYRADMLAASIKAADDIMQVRFAHRNEFGTDLDRDAFEKFVNEQQAAGVRFKDMKSAHDTFVADKRVANTVATQVAEQVKQKMSAATVPGQTQTVALSPAQQVLKKAREGAKGGDGKSNAMVAAAKLAQLQRAREEGDAGTVQ